MSRDLFFSLEQCEGDDVDGVLTCAFSNDIARSAGVIMDRCTRGDNTVSGAAYIPQGGVAVQIQGQ